MRSQLANQVLKTRTGKKAHGSTGIDVVDNSVRGIVVVPEIPVVKERVAAPRLLEVPERVVLLVGNR